MTTFRNIFRTITPALVVEAQLDDALMQELEIHQRIEISLAQAESDRGRLKVHQLKIVRLRKHQKKLLDETAAVSNALVAALEEQAANAPKDPALVPRVKRFLSAVRGSKDVYTDKGKERKEPSKSLLTEESLSKKAS